MKQVNLKLLGGLLLVVGLCLLLALGGMWVKKIAEPDVTEMAWVEKEIPMAELSEVTISGMDVTADGDIYVSVQEDTGTQLAYKAVIIGEVYRVHDGKWESTGVIRSFHSPLIGNVGGGDMIVAYRGPWQIEGWRDGATVWERRWERGGYSNILVDAVAEDWEHLFVLEAVGVENETSWEMRVWRAQGEDWEVVLGADGEELVVDGVMRGEWPMLVAGPTAESFYLVWLAAGEGGKTLEIAYWEDGVWQDAGIPQALMAARGRNEKSELLVQGVGDSLYVGWVEKSRGDMLVSMYVRQEGVWELLGEEPFVSVDRGEGWLHDDVGMNVDEAGNVYVAWSFAQDHVEVVQWDGEYWQSLVTLPQEQFQSKRNYRIEDIGVTTVGESVCVIMGGVRETTAEDVAVGAEVQAELAERLLAQGMTTEEVNQEIARLRIRPEGWWERLRLWCWEEVG